MRHALTGAALLLVVGTTAACGGSTPTDASKEDFCETYTSAMGNPDPDVDDIHDLADDLEDTGTPENASDQERRGFEVYVDVLKDVDEDNWDKIGKEENAFDLSEQEQEDLAAFNGYASETCADQVEEQRTEMEPDVPDDSPTED